MVNNWSDLKVEQRKKGPEDGDVLIEADLPGISHIIVEKKTNQISGDEIYPVTTIIYDKLVNTAFFKNREDAEEHVSSTKLMLIITCT